MKNIKRLLLCVCAIACASILPSCSNSDSDKWSYAKEDITDFLELEGDISSIDGNLQDNIISFSFTQPIFSKEIDSDGLLFFDSAAALEELNESSKEYLDYSIIKNHLIDTVSIKTGENLDTLDIQYPNEYTNVSGLIHKDYVQSGNFLCLTEYEEEKEDDDSQQVIEKRYADSSFWEDKGGDFVTSLIVSLGVAIVGGLADNPGNIVTGIAGVIGSIASIFLPSEPSIADVMKQLMVIEQKLNEIMAKLDLNFNQLKDEELRTQTKVDKTILEAQTAAITAFQTDYVKPVDDFKRTLSVGVQNNLKSFVKTSEKFDIKLYKNDEGKWCYRSLAAKQGANDTTLSFTVSGFAKSLADLKAHDDVITTTFMDALREDIDVVIKATALPTGLEEKDALDFAYSYVNDLMIKNYFLSNEGKATEIMNLAINLSKRYSGALGGESIVSTLLKRYEYFYNFACEMRQPLITTIARQMNYLDSTVALAAIGCKYAAINVTELHDNYVVGRKVLSDANASFKNVKDGYSFILNQNLNGGGVYYVIYNNWSTNKGNHPTYHYELESYHETGGHHGTSYECDMTEEATKSISNLDHRRLSYRMNALKQIGAIDAKLTYTDYLGKVGILSKDTLETIESVKKAGFWSDDCNKWLTTFSVRAADSRDKGRDIWCNDKANPHGKWFKENEYYKYGESHNWKNWSGEVAEGDFVSGVSGELLADKYMNMYAKYDEGHWYWKNDERWSFYSRPVCRFLILQYE